VGVSFGYGLNDDEISLGSSSRTEENKYTDISLLFGTGEDGGFKIEGRLGIISYSETIYNPDSSTLFEIGVDGIKEWQIDEMFFPYLKAGLSGGYISLDENYYDSPLAASFSLNAGLGLSIKATDKMNVVVGVDYVYRKWQDVDIGFLTLSRDGRGFKPYLGVNIGF
jgi:opacity protein-like surface antigen